MKQISANSAGFTLIEIVIVIVVIGIVAVFTVPTFQSVHVEAQKSSVTSSLGTVRTSLSMWQQANIVAGGDTLWPSLGQLPTRNEVLSTEMPVNPFQGEENAPDSVVEGFVFGQVVGSRGGWAYKPSTGQFWANTNTTIPGSGCSGGENVNENSW